MLLSLLIPTLEDRRSQLDQLVNHLHRQMDRSHLRAEIEVFTLSDRGELPVGRKRNHLLNQARGQFVAFIDDDDEICDDYVPRICTALREHPQIDCIGLRGIVSFRGRRPRPFIHSLRYRDYCTREGILCRPPYHLNPIRRTIARRYPFAEVRYGEDADWALRLSRDRVLRSEHFIDAELYHYRSRRWWAYQQLLDASEGVRLAFGLRQTNLVRLWRLLRPGAGSANLGLAAAPEART